MDFESDNALSLLSPLAPPELRNFSVLAKQQLSFVWGPNGALRLAQPEDLDGFWRAWSDGAYDASSKTGGVGGLLKDDQGAAIALFSRTLTQSDYKGLAPGALEAEREALAQVLDLAAEAGARRVEIQLDCLPLIERVISAHHKPETDESPERAILLALRRFDQAALRWIPRALNGLADALSKRPAGKGALFGGAHCVEAFERSVETGAPFTPSAAAQEKTQARALSLLSKRKPKRPLFQPRQESQPKRASPEIHQERQSQEPIEWVIGVAFPIAGKKERAWEASCARLLISEDGDEMETLEPRARRSWASNDERGDPAGAKSIADAFQLIIQQDTARVISSNRGVARLSPELYDWLEANQYLAKLEKRLSNIVNKKNPSFFIALAPDLQFAPVLDRSLTQDRNPFNPSGKSSPSKTR